MPDDAGLHQLMRQHGHRQTRGAADLHRVGVDGLDAEMFGEHGGEHDVRRDGGVTAEDTVDLRAFQAGVSDRKLGGLAHQVQRGRALVLAVNRQSDAGDEAHVSRTRMTTARRHSSFVIPGCANRIRVYPSSAISWSKSATADLDAQARNPYS